MISRLKGIVDDRAPDSAIVDVGGVGYQVFCSLRTGDRMPAVGQPVRLEIETHVREDHIHLYGFIDEAEREWFRLLTTVQGVGARVALAILSVLGPDDLVQAIAAQDKTAVSRANGVGPKVAGRIVSELRDKVGGLAMPESAIVIGVTGAPAGGDAGPLGDAVSALVNLGYSRTEAYGAATRAGGRLGADADVSELIKGSLLELSQ